MLNQQLLKDLTQQFNAGLITDLELLHQVQLPTEVRDRINQVMGMPEGVRMKLSINDLWPDEADKPKRKDLTESEDTAKPKAPPTPKSSKTRAEEYYAKIARLIDLVPSRLRTGLVIQSTGDGFHEEFGKAFIFNSKHMAVAFAKRFLGNVDLDAVIKSEDHAGYLVELSAEKLEELDIVPPADEIDLRDTKAVSRGFYGNLQEFVFDGEDVEGYFRNPEVGHHSDPQMGLIYELCFHNKRSADVTYAALAKGLPDGKRHHLAQLKAGGFFVVEANKATMHAHALFVPVHILED